MAKTTKLKCTCCGKEKPPTTGFYLSHSPLYVNNNGRMTICKECLVDRYKEYIRKYEDEVKALYHICMNLDIYFNQELIESAFKQDRRGNDDDGLLKAYITKVNSLMQYKGKSSYDSDYIVLDKDIIKKIEEKYKAEFDKLIDRENLDSSKKDKKITKNIRKRWGSEYTDEDCMLLEDYYEDYFNNMNHDNDYGKLEILKEVCGFKLIIAQAKKDRDHKTIKDFTELISKRMTDGGLKPSQQKKIGEGSEDTFGVRLRIYETEKPVPEIQKSLKDIDKFWKYHLRYLVKPFAMAMDLAKGTYSIEDGDNIELNKELSEHISEEVETVE